MGPYPEKQNIPKIGRQRSVPKDKEARPQVVRNGGTQLSSPKSARLRLRQERTAPKGTNIEPRPLLPSPSSNTLSKEACHSPPTIEELKRTRKRKRLQDKPTLLSSATPSPKRLRTSPQSYIQGTIGENGAVGDSEEQINPLEYWTRELRWPKEYFEPGVNMNHLLARKKSSVSFRGQLSEAGSAAPSSTTPSDQKPREAKSAPYQSPQYKILLETKDSFMRKSELDIADTSKTVCRTLLEAKQLVPEDSLFQDNFFDKTCEMIQDRNEAKVI